MSFENLIGFIREQFQTNEFIPLHAPVFKGNEKRYVAETIDSTFVSSVGPFVDRFENDMASYTGSPRAVATVNGTAALHIALKLAGVAEGHLVLTQPLSFIATCNAISYCHATPVFIDVSLDNLGLCPVALEAWLNEHARIDDDGVCRSKAENKIISACVPMHTFGHPADLDGLLDVCQRWHIALVEDAAESLGSFYKGKHTGTYGLVGAISFNGNKIITTGGGGMILTNQALGQKAKHLTTTAKVPHPYEYVHDEVGYNYRLPNINAALGCAQLEQIETFIAAKRQLADRYDAALSGSNLRFVKEGEHCRANYWLNAVICENRQERDALLKTSNEQGVMTRPVWELMSNLPLYQHCLHGQLENAQWLADCIVNLPSSVPESLHAQ
jgi:aminotransferase in exopolysaccharide biosynthesis